MLVSLIISLTIAVALTQVAAFSTTIYLHRGVTHRAVRARHQDGPLIAGCSIAASSAWIIGTAVLCSLIGVGWGLLAAGLHGIIHVFFLSSVDQRPLPRAGLSNV